MIQKISIAILMLLLCSTVKSQDLLQSTYLGKEVPYKDNIINPAAELIASRKLSGATFVQKKLTNQSSKERAETPEIINYQTRTTRGNPDRGLTGIFRISPGDREK